MDHWQPCQCRITFCCFIVVYMCTTCRCASRSFVTISNGSNQSSSGQSTGRRSCPQSCSQCSTRTSQIYTSAISYVSSRLPVKIPVFSAQSRASCLRHKYPTRLVVSQQSFNAQRRLLRQTTSCCFSTACLFTTQLPLSLSSPSSTHNNNKTPPTTHHVSAHQNQAKRTSLL